MKPLGAAGRGAAAGVIGTAVMTAAQELYGKLQSSGGGSGGGGDDQDPWEQASAPAKVGKRIIEGVFKTEVGEGMIGPLTHAMHWGYGIGNGVAFGLLQPTIGGGRPVRNGLGFGLAVMASSYAQMVPMGLYQPPWKYSPAELAPELGFHLAYGAGVGVGWVLVRE